MADGATEFTGQLKTAGQAAPAQPSQVQGMSVNYQTSNPYGIPAVQTPVGFESKQLQNVTTEPVQTAGQVNQQVAGPNQVAGPVNQQVAGPQPQVVPQNQQVAGPTYQPVAQAAAAIQTPQAGTIQKETPKAETAPALNTSENGYGAPTSPAASTTAAPTPTAEAAKAEAKIASDTGYGDTMAGYNETQKTPEQTAIDQSQTKTTSMLDGIMSSINALSALSDTGNIDTASSASLLNDAIYQASMGQLDSYSKAITDSLAKRATLAETAYNDSKARWDGLSSQMLDVAAQQKDNALEENKIAQQEAANQYADTLTMMRDNNSRYEGYLKGKFAAAGMLDSGAGLMALGKYMASADANIASVSKQAESANRYYLSQARGIMTDYFNQSLTVQKEYNAALDTNTNSYISRLDAIESDRTTSDTKKMEMSISALSAADTRQREIKATAFAQKAQILGLNLQAAQFQYQATQDAIKNDQFERQFGQSKYEFAANYGLNVKQYNESVRQFGETYALQEQQLAFNKWNSEQQNKFQYTQLAQQKDLAEKELNKGSYQQVETYDEFGNKVTGAFNQSTGTYSFPNGTVTQNFGDTSPVSADNRPVLMNDGTTKVGTPGLDIDGKIGDPIPSTVQGTVVKTLTEAQSGGLGNSVVVKDNQGNLHYFNHLSEIDVSVGQQVNNGNLVGKMGNSGIHIAGPGGDGSHLDYRVKDANGNWIDPNNFVGSVGTTGPQKPVYDQSKASASTEAENAIVSDQDIQAKLNKYTPNVKSLGDAILENENARASILSGQNSDIKQAVTNYIETYKKSSAYKNDTAKIVDSVIAGKQPPVFTGMGRAGKVFDIRASLADKGFDLVNATANWEAYKKSISSLNSSQITTIKAKINTLDHSLDYMKQLSDGVERATGIKEFNNFVLDRAESGWFGQKTQEDAVKLKTQINDLQTEIAQVFSGGYAPQLASINLSLDQLNSGWSKETFNGAIDNIRKNLEFRLSGLNSVTYSVPGQGSDSNMYGDQNNTGSIDFSSAVDPFTTNSNR